MKKSQLQKQNFEPETGQQLNDLKRFQQQKLNRTFHAKEVKETKKSPTETFFWFSSNFRYSHNTDTWFRVSNYG